MAGQITRCFGTPRGAARLALSYAELALGMAPLIVPKPDQLRRFVFVCHGNICRSAYAEALARRAGYATASFGLSTTTGTAAWPPLAALTEERGVSLERHAATAVADYQHQAGDYLLVMEVRHLRRLAADPQLALQPRGLLGSYARFPVPHLHDPYKLDPAYIATCLTRIEDAVARLCLSYPAARSA
jgi:protein-tyrosine phosphatase